MWPDGPTTTLSHSRCVSRASRSSREKPGPLPPIRPRRQAALPDPPRSRSPSTLSPRGDRDVRAAAGPATTADTGALARALPGPGPSTDSRDRDPRGSPRTPALGRPRLGFVSFLREGGRPVADSIHIGDCRLAARHRKPLSRHEARRALTDGGIRAC
ncbi:DUF6233 domain-containing protein [Streptomyces sp. NPDC087219]|uniref:DUF6233 domain-containing protein n=1 Tax=Streptomyces sp. NPDC087219 TaxID=3365770 RepID=UPI00382A446C